MRLGDIIDRIHTNLTGIPSLEVFRLQQREFVGLEMGTYRGVSLELDMDSRENEEVITFGWEFRRLTVAIIIFVMADYNLVNGVFQSLVAEIETALRADWTLGGLVIELEHEPGLEDVTPPVNQDEVRGRPTITSVDRWTAHYVVEEITGELLEA